MTETSSPDLPRSSSLDTIPEIGERCQKLWAKIREILDNEQEILIPAMIQHQLRLAIIEAQHDAAQRQVQLDYKAARQATQELIHEIFQQRGEDDGTSQDQDNDLPH